MELYSIGAMRSIVGLVGILATATCYLYLLSTHLPPVSPAPSDNADEDSEVKEYR